MKTILRFHGDEIGRFETGADILEFVRDAEGLTHDLTCLCDLAGYGYSIEPVKHLEFME